MTSQTGPIVVGYDASPASRQALRWAAAQAVREHAPVRIVQILEIYVAMRPLGALVPPESFEGYVQQALEKAADGIRSDHPGLEVGTELLQASPAPVLIAESEDARMLVLGTRGLGGWAGLLMGSVAGRPVRRPPGPRRAPRPGLRPRA